MLPAGKRDKRIRFQRETTEQDALGMVNATGWTEIGAPDGGRWAQVLFGTGAERRAAGVEQAVQSATFRVLADSLTASVTVQDRISFRSAVWDITGKAEIGSGPAELEFTAVASRG